MNVTVPTGGTRELASLPLDAVLARLGTDPGTGLAAPEAARRLATGGYNEVPPQRAHPALALLRKFTGILGINDAVKVRVLRRGTDGGERGDAPARPHPGGRA